MSESRAFVWIVTVGALLMCGATLAHAENKNQQQNRNQGQRQQGGKNDTYYDQKLGARLKKVPQGYEVVSLSKRGEAAKAGLKKGDIIVDSKPMMQAMVNGKKAPPSTQLNVINGSNGKRRSIDLIGVIIGAIGHHGGNNGGGGGSGNQEYVYDATITPVSFYNGGHDLDGKDEYKIYILAKMDVPGTPLKQGVYRWEARGLPSGTTQYAGNGNIVIKNVSRPVNIYANVTAHDKHVFDNGEDQPTFGHSATKDLQSLPKNGTHSYDDTLDGRSWRLNYHVEYRPRLVNDNQSSGNRSTARSNR